MLETEQTIIGQKQLGLKKEEKIELPIASDRILGFGVYHREVWLYGYLDEEVLRKDERLTGFINSNTKWEKGMNDEPLTHLFYPEWVKPVITFEGERIL